MFKTRMLEWSSHAKIIITSLEVVVSTKMLESIIQFEVVDA